MADPLTPLGNIKSALHLRWCAALTDKWITFVDDRCATEVGLHRKPVFVVATRKLTN